MGSGRRSNSVRTFLPLFPFFFAGPSIPAREGGGGGCCQSFGAQKAGGGGGRKDGSVGLLHRPFLQGDPSLPPFFPVTTGDQSTPLVSRHPSKKQEEKEGGGEDAELRMKLDVLPLPPSSLNQRSVPLFKA